VKHCSQILAQRLTTTQIERLVDAGVVWGLLRCGTSGCNQRLDLVFVLRGKFPCQYNYAYTLSRCAVSALYLLVSSDSRSRWLRLGMKWIDDREVVDMLALSILFAPTPLLNTH